MRKVLIWTLGLVVLIFILPAILTNKKILSTSSKENNEITETIIASMIKYGIPMDSTYTGKAYLGMRKYIEKEKIKDKKVLFIHTGGTPLFFDDLGRM